MSDIQQDYYTLLNENTNLYSQISLERVLFGIALFVAFFLGYVAKAEGWL
jgi:hypothetical protein